MAAPIFSRTFSHTFRHLVLVLAGCSPSPFRTPYCDESRFSRSVKGTPCLCALYLPIYRTPMDQIGANRRAIVPFSPFHRRLRMRNDFGTEQQYAKDRKKKSVGHRIVTGGLQFLAVSQSHWKKTLLLSNSEPHCGSIFLPLWTTTQDTVRVTDDSVLL